MIKINTSFLDKNLQKGLDMLSPFYGFKTGSGIKVFCQKSEKDLKVTYDRKSLYISCPDTSAFYRGFGHFLQNSDSEFTVSESRQFKKCGFMFDNTKGGVFNLSATKYLLIKLAFMGYNTFYPLLKDAFAIEQNALFGYRKSKYTEEELKEIDAFASLLGIEVIVGVELSGDDALNDAVINFMQKCFKSRNLFVKCTNAEKIDSIGKIADRYGMHLQIENNGEILLPTNATKVVFTDGVIEDITQVQTDAKAKPIFAGSIVKNIGFVPNHTRSVKNAEQNLTLCKQAKVEEVFVAAFNDGGCECPPVTVLYTLAFWAEQAFNKSVVNKVFTSRLKFLTGMTSEDWLLQEKIDYPDSKQGLLNANMSKVILYSDVLCGVYDENIERVNEVFTPAHYVSLSTKLKRSSKECDLELKNTQLMYAYLCDVLELKCNLSSRLRQAYNDKDRIKLLEIRDDIVNYVIPRNEYLRKHLRTLWEQWYSSYGFEVLDIRLGGVSARLKTVVDMIYEFDEGKLKQISPLEEELKTLEEELVFVQNNYSKIATIQDLD